MPAMFISFRDSLTCALANCSHCAAALPAASASVASIACCSATVRRSATSKSERKATRSCGRTSCAAAPCRFASASVMPGTGLTRAAVAAAQTSVAAPMVSIDRR